MQKQVSFRCVVRKNEFQAIAGYRFRTIAYLTGILVLTFLCIGFSYKALEYQKKLSVNPFSNWINIESTKSVQDSSLNLSADLANPVLKSRFLIKNIYLSKGFGASFLDRHGISSGLPLPKARTINARSSIMLDLPDSENPPKPRLSGNVFQKDPFGFVVTDKFLKKLGFHRDSVKYLLYGLYGETYVPVPILGVVKELPDHADVVCTDSFYIMKSYCYREDAAYSKLFIETTDRREAEQFRNTLLQAFKLTDISMVYDKKKGITILGFYNEDPVKQEIEKNGLDSLYQVPGLRKFHFGRYTQVVTDTSQETKNIYLKKKKNFNFDFLAVEFSRLDKLKEFSDYIKKRYNVSINMETVEQRQNFLFSLNISLGSILLVLIISGFSILIFLSNSLRNHLDKVKRNLGNFLAFGANRNIIIEIYTYVILKILLISIAIAFIFSYCAGEFFENFILKRLLILKTDQDFFSLLNLWVVIFILAIIIVSVSKTVVTVWILVRKSPGDLIYEREKRSSNK